MARSKTASRKTKPSADRKTSARPLNPRKKSADRKRELETLRSRLAEAEETLNAIRNCEVDALLIAKPDGDQVFTLKGAEHIYRVLVEEMNEGAVTVNSDGMILFGNNALVSMIEAPLEKIVGAPLQKYVSEKDIPAFESFMKRCMHAGTKLELSLKKQSGKYIRVLFSGGRLAFDKDSAWISIVITDLTLQKMVEANLEQDRKELEKRFEERTFELKIHQIELESQNEELRTAQQELEVSRRKYHELYDYAPVGYFSIDLNGIIREVNQAGSLLLGIEKANLINKPFSRFIAESPDKDTYYIHLKATFKTQTPGSCELKLKRADRSIFHVRLQSVAAEDTDGNATMIRTTVMDITERKRAEEALRESEAMLQSFFDGSSFLMGVMELNGPDVVLIHGNKAFAAFLGVRSDNISGRTGTELGIAKEVTQLWAEHFRRAQSEEGTPVRFDYEHPATSAGRWLNASVSFLKESPSGRPRFSFVAEDITERKRLNSAVKEIAEKYSTIVSTSTDGIWIHGLDGRIREVNDAYCRMSGYSRGELEGMPISTLEMEETPEAIAERIKRVVQGGGHDRFESRHRRKDGSIFDVDITVLYVPKEQGIVIFTRDITYRKRFEEALKESEKRYHSLFENMSEGFAYCRMIYGEDGSPVDFVYLDVNGSFVEITGLENVEGRRVTEVIPGIKKSHPELIDIYGGVASTGKPERFEIEFKPLGMWLNISVYSIERGYFVAVFDDITERKRAEETLREDERRERDRAEELAAMLEAVPIPVIIVHDSEAMHMTGNRAADALLRHPRGSEISLSAPVEVRPLHFKPFKDGRELRLDELPGQRAARGEYVQDFEFDLVFDDGAVLHLLGHGTPLLDGQGCPRGAVHVLVDITARKRAEVDLEQASRKLNDIVESVSDGFMALDREWRFTYINKRAAENIGRGQEELIGKVIWEMFPRILGTEHERYYRLSMEQRVVQHFDLRGLLTDEWYEISVYPTSEGISVYWLNVFDRKRDQERIRQQNAILDGINRIFQAGLFFDTEDEIGKECLKIAQDVTGSKFGFMGQIGPDGLLHDIALSDPGWELCAMRDKAGHRSQPGYFKLKGLYGHVLLTGKSFYTNDPASHPESIGVPQGHPPVTAFLGAPLMLNKKTIGIVGLANREGGYRREDQEALDALTAVIMQVYLRMQAESGLRKNRERLREYVNLLEYAPLVVRNMKDEIILWNKGMERMYGYSSAEAISRHIFEFLKAELPRPIEEIKTALAEAGTWEGEIKHVTCDGRTITVSSLWVLHKNADGEATAVIEINSDITERRRAEEQLQKVNEELEERVRRRTADLARTISTLQAEISDRIEAEEALRKSQFNLSKAQSIAHIGSWSYDFLAEKFAASEEFFKIFGLKPDSREIDLKSILGMIHSGDRGKVRDKLRELRSLQTTEAVDYRIIVPDGTTRVVWTEAQLISDSERRPLSVVGTVQDITERKQAEDELNRLATAVNAAADALVVTDPVRGFIQYVNPTFEKLTGYSREEVIGRDLHILDSGKHDAVFYEKLREDLRRNGFWTGRLVQKKKDGTLYEEECTYSLVRNNAGEVINWISIKRDVTEKVRLESIAQAMETMNNIGYIFSGVCHELGNPVNAMRMTLDILKRRSNELSADKISSYVDKAVGQLARVEYLLASLKNFNMYEYMQPRTIETASFIEIFLNMIRQDFEEKRITITCNVDPLCRSLIADPRALQQVLLNIVTNAADALAGRDEPNITLHICREGDRVLIHVRDNGVGIAEAQLKDLFKPFYTTKEKGTGLGLVIIRKMLAKMNGTVEVRSRLNEGTLVEISLPAN